MSSALPPGWEWRTVGELAANEPNAITDGPFGSRLKTEHYTKTGPRVIRLTNVGDGDFIDAYAHISQAHYSALAKHRVLPGDIVIAALGETLPRSCLIPTSVGPAIVKADCIRFKPSAEHSAKYLNHALNWEGTRKRTAAIVHGVGRPRLNSSEIKSISLPVPRADEQHRIVAEIEKQFTRCDAGVAALRQVQAKLKRYRAAILKAACEGRLVPTEAELARRAGRDYETGEQLLARILVDRRQRWIGRGKYKEPAVLDTKNPLPAPEGWAWATWDQIGFSQNGRPFPSARYAAVGFKLLRPGNLHWTGKVVWTDDNTRRMPQRFVIENPDLIVRELELVMNLTAQSLKDEFLGRICLTSDDEECLLNQRLARLIPIWVLPRYVLYTFKSWRFRRFVDGLNSGSLIQHMFTSQLAEFGVLLPPLAEQARIIAEVERRLSVVAALEQAASASLQRAARLRQSILQRAFSGQLVTSEPAGAVKSAAVPNRRRRR